MALGQFTINNISSATVTYQGQAILSGASYTPSSALQRSFATDPAVIADCLSNIITISIGNTNMNIMFGLEVLKSAGEDTNRILGADTSGNDTNFLNVTAEQETYAKVSPEPLFNVTHKANRILNGSSAAMNVNGSVTPVSFRFTPASGETWFLRGLGFGIQDGGAQDTTLFGNLAALTNGLQINVRTNGVVYEITNIKDNFDITMFFSGLNGGGASIIGLGGGWLDDSKAYVASTVFAQPIKMANSTGDYIEFLVRDNLTGITQLRSFYSAQRRS